MESIKSTPVAVQGKGETYLNNKIQYYKKLDDIRAWPNSYKIESPIYGPDSMSPRVKGPDSLQIDPR